MNRNGNPGCFDENENPAAKKHETTWRHMWNWMSGGLDEQTTHQTNGNFTRNIEALGDENPDVRSDAADALGMLGESAADAIQHLGEALCDDYEPVRLNAAYALGAIGAPAVDTLIEKLTDEKASARRLAAYGLAAIGEPAVTALSEMMDS